jgi:hypothetical protein
MRQRRRKYPSVMARTDRLLSSREVATMLECQLPTARRFMTRECLGRKIGGRFKIRLSTLLANYPEIAGTVMFL